MISAKIATAALLFAGAFLCSAGEVYNLDRVEDWQDRSPLTQHAQGILRGRGRLVVLTAKHYPYDVKKTYKIKGLYRQLVGSDSNVFRVGIVQYDKNKQEMEFASGRIVPKTETVLIKAATATDTAIFVKDASAWKRNALVAYAKTVKQLSPKDNITLKLRSIEKSGDGWKISFIGPINVDLPAGTAVRQYNSAGRFRFCGSGTDIQVLGDMTCTNWHPRTKYFRPVVISGANGIKTGEESPVFEMRFPRIEVSE
jgi:hypothetical protein